MYLGRFSTLLLAFVLAGPALWHGFVTKDLAVTTALIRLLIAVPVAAIMIAAVRSLTSGYRQPDRPEPVRAEAVTGPPLASRRATD